jgi:hypothetical protein
MYKDDPTIRKLSLAHWLPDIGDETQEHVDELPHEHILICGEVIFCPKDGDEVRYVAPAVVPVAAKVPHRFIALQPATCFVCAFPFQRNKDSLG